jgi:transposase-like protein
MSPPNRESVPELARDTGIAVQTLYSWRSQWQKQGLLVPATSRPSEQWSPADKLATVIQTAGLSGVELGSFCRERGLYPKRWRPQQWCKSSGTPTPATPGWAAHLRRLA